MRVCPSLAVILLRYLCSRKFYQSLLVVVSTYLARWDVGRFPSCSKVGEIVFCQRVR